MKLDKDTHKTPNLLEINIIKFIQNTLNNRDKEQNTIFPLLSSVCFHSSEDNRFDTQYELILINFTHRDNFINNNN